MFHIFANLCVLVLSQKHGDDQILHDFAAIYELCVDKNNFTDYNTHLFDDNGHVYTLRPGNKQQLYYMPPPRPSPRSKIDLTLKYHSPTLPPPQYPQPYAEFLCSSEGIVQPPLVSLMCLLVNFKQKLFLPRRKID